MVDPPPLIRPVEGPVASRFSYDRAAPFRRGRRRVVRFSVSPGAVVRAPCAGRVAHAGSTPGGPAVTLRCGGWSVTLTGVSPDGVRRGHAIRAGRPIARGRPAADARAPSATDARVSSATDARGPSATNARGRGATVGFGVRRASDPFGYVDPLPLLRDRGPARRFVPLGPAPRTRPVAPVPVPVVRAPRPVPDSPRPGPSRTPAADPRNLPAAPPAGSPRPAPAAPPTERPGIPGLAWVGLALVALGLPAGAIGLRVRRPLVRGARSPASRTGT